MVRLRKSFFVVGMVLVGAICAAAAGLASITTESATVSLEPEELGTATAKCPRKSEVVANGFRGEWDRDAFLEVHVYPPDSSRVGQRRANGSGLSLGATAGDLTSYAYCRRPKPSLEVVRSEPVEVGSLEKESAQVRCPRGSEAVGGGSSSPQFVFEGPQVYTIASRRVGKRKWVVTGAETNNGSGGTIIAIAYCDKSEPGLTARSKLRQVRDPLDRESFTAKASCPRRHPVQSGGFKSVGFDPTTVGPTIYPTASKRSGSRRWLVEMAANDPVDGDFVAYAYCK